MDTALEATDEKMPNTKRDILYYKATALYKNKDYENTISVCDEILTLNQEGDACYLRGACYMAQGDYDKAKTDFDAAVALSPKDYDLVLDIYGCYQEQKRSADGAPYLENALNIEDSSDEGSYQKARIYFYLEDYDNAHHIQAEIDLCHCFQPNLLHHLFPLALKIVWYFVYNLPILYHFLCKSQ